VKTNFETLVNLVICAEKESKPRHELVLNIGLTPQRLVGLGFDALTLVVKAKTIGKMFFEHALTQGQIEKIPAMLEAPRAIYRSDTHPTNMVVLTYELKAGFPIIIPIARDRQVGRGPLVNEVVSMYAKTGPDPTRRWRDQGLLLWEKSGQQRR
jgi:Phage MuF-C-terminal domain